MTRPVPCERNVPLFLIARAVADGVKQRGARLYRISIVRIREHQYRIRYTCRNRPLRERRHGKRVRFRLFGQETLERFSQG